jgi:hypothetical protein
METSRPDSEWTPLGDFPPVNARVSEAFELGLGLVCRAIEMPTTAGLPVHVELVLVIDEKTDFERVSKYRLRLRRLSRSINRAEGSDLIAQHLLFVVDAYHWRKEQMAWSTMAKLLNYIALALMLSAHGGNRKLAGQRAGIGRHPGDQDGSPRATSDKRLLLHLLSIFGTAKDDPAPWIELGHESLGKGQLPWEVDQGPILEWHLKDHVKYLRERVDSQRIHIGEAETAFNALEGIVFRLRKQGTLAELDQLLDRKGQRSWTRNRAKIQMWVGRFVQRTF